MKRIAIFCVNYNSYKELYHYLDSICVSAKKVEDVMKVDLFVADNTEQQSQDISYEAQHIQIQVFPFHRNLGYFGAVGKMMQQVDTTVYDYCIISNVDLILDKDMLMKLAEYPNNATTGWIAPQIWSQQERRDRNPKIMNRYPLHKLKKLQTLFKYPLLYALYTMTLYRRKKFQRHSAGVIYAGHGSFIILTQKFMEKCGPVDYPVFLFCEEIYIAEICRQHQLTVEYLPTLKVNDMEHASTRHMPSRLYCRQNYDAISYIINRFYSPLS